LKFLIVEGYSEPSRSALAAAGMSLSSDLYARMLRRVLPKAEVEVFHPSDPGARFPTNKDLTGFAGIMWTGADLNINHLHVPTIVAQIDLARRAYEVGIPSCGSCWGIQIAAVAAGGRVEPNPRGREMGIGRKIMLTDAGRRHPMMEGKPQVFDGFESHYDMVVEVPEGGTLLATNEFTPVQALAVTKGRGTFWATQYHPEYNLREMARLTVARAEVLIEHGLFRDREDVQRLVERWELLHDDPARRDLRWQLAVGDDILSDSIRQREIYNWIHKLVLPAQK
jgi:GMP synthase (glutamine-hydrolysing)